MTTTEKLPPNDQKKKTEDRALKLAYPTTEFGGGIWRSFFVTYQSMLFMDVFLFSALMTTILELFRNVLAWGAAPFFGALCDRHTFKTGKFWPYILWGSIVTGIVFLIMFILPFTLPNPAGAVVIIFGLSLLLAVAEPMTNAALMSCYPKLVKEPIERTWMSSARAIGRQVGLALFGLLVPIMIISFATPGLGGDGAGDPRGWAMTAIMLAPMGLVFYLITAFTMKRSKLEKDMVAQSIAEKTGEQKKLTLSIMLKSVLTNKPLLGIFLFFSLYQLFSFTQQMSAGWLFRWYYDDFASTGLFQTARSLTNAGATLLAVPFVKFIKDTRRAFFIACAGVIISIFFLHMTIPMGRNYLLAMTIIQNIFAGVVVALLMPLFAAAGDYSTHKTGVRIDGLVMGVYALSIRVGITFSATFRTAVLGAIGYDPAAYMAGEPVPAHVLEGLRNLMGLFPLIICIIATIIGIILYRLSDKQMDEIRADIKARGIA